MSFRKHIYKKKGRDGLERDFVVCFQLFLSQKEIIVPGTLLALFCIS